MLPLRGIGGWVVVLKWRDLGQEWLQHGNCSAVRLSVSPDVRRLLQKRTAAECCLGMLRIPALLWPVMPVDSNMQGCGCDNTGDDAHMYVGRGCSTCVVLAEAVVMVESGVGMAAAWQLLSSAPLCQSLSLGGCCSSAQPHSVVLASWAGLVCVINLLGPHALCSSVPLHAMGYTRKQPQGHEPNGGVGQLPCFCGPGTGHLLG